MINTTPLYLGIELGSTRIKSVLADQNGNVCAGGSHTWENRLENGLWTYSETDISEGFRACVEDLVRNYGAVPEISALGISAMMHGYIALDKEGNFLAPFLTWRNTNAGEAAEALTAAFGVNIPMRWSIAQLYQAILNGEDHVKDIAHITTLAGYVHYRLTGEFVLGIGDASGMFPIDSEAKDYDATLMDRFEAMIAERNYPWKLRDILPRVLCAGEPAGELTESGAAYMGGMISPGIRLAPPEGDAGTGMVATNSVKVGTGNVSAGTSIFAMIVMDRPLSTLHTELDPVTTPDGNPVSMVHCNNCTSDINAWGELLLGFAKRLGVELELRTVLEQLWCAATDAKGDPTGLLSYNFLSGEPVAGTDAGVPMVLRRPDVKLDFADFARAQLYGCVAGLALGMEILAEEGISVSSLTGHGGFFKTPEVGQTVMSSAIGAPVSVLETAGEGGAWGMALLAALTDAGLSLTEYLDQVFALQQVKTVMATPEQRQEFSSYLAAYKKGLTVEQTAVRELR